MKIFTLYMARKFFKPFLFGLGLFALLIFLGDMFDKMNYLFKTKASLWVVFQYLWLEVPYWTIRVIPMATLLATLVAITGFVQSGEWIAAQASGFKTRDFWRPVLGCSVLVALLSFAAQETVLPACYLRYQRLWQEKIHPEWEWSRYFNIALMGGPDQFIEAKVFFPKQGRLERPTLETVGPQGLEKQFDAELALWDAGARRWVFYNGVERRFGAGAPREEAFQKRASELSAPPAELIPRPQDPDEMSWRELRRYAARVSRLGVPVRDLDVAAYGKLAYPFTNIVICALGIPIALRLKRAARAVSFSAALGLSFFYFWVIEIGRALGTGGQLGPFTAAWSANILFGAAAVFLIRRYDA